MYFVLQQRIIDPFQLVTYFSSFASGVNSYLQEYAASILEVEKEFNQYPDQPIIIIKDHLSDVFFDCWYSYLVLFNSSSFVFFLSVTERPYQWQHLLDQSAVQLLSDWSRSDSYNVQTVYLWMFTIINRIYNKCITIFSNQLYQWILFGNLNDPYKYALTVLFIS